MWKTCHGKHFAEDCVAESALEKPSCGKRTTENALRKTRCRKRIRKNSFGKHVREDCATENQVKGLWGGATKAAACFEKRVSQNSPMCFGKRVSRISAMCFGSCAWPWTLGRPFQERFSRGGGSFREDSFGRLLQSLLMRGHIFRLCASFEAPLRRGSFGMLLQGGLWGIPSETLVRGEGRTVRLTSTGTRCLNGAR